MPNNTSPHILSTAANLLGFCLVVITSLHLTNRAENSIVDELTAVIALLLTVSSILSFASIKTRRPRLEQCLEQAADYLFIGALLGILGIIAFIFLHLWLQGRQM